MKAKRESQADLYGASYFATYGGVPYERTDHWLTFFGRIADKIVQGIRPKTVLDAGCAMGFLVEALRDRGVQAYGIDVSEYAINRVREDITRWCRVASVTDPLDRDYDLITCIEVLEHLPAEDAIAALDNLCSHTDDLLFSSTPSDFTEPTHVNVRPPEFWAEELLKRGFLRDVDFDASLVTDWAGRFRRGSTSAEATIGRYEHHLVRLIAENRAVRDDLRRLYLSRTYRYSRPLRAVYARVDSVARRRPWRA